MAKKSIYRYATYYLPQTLLVLIENVNKIAQFTKEVFVRKSTNSKHFLGADSLTISFHKQTIAAPSSVHQNDGAAMRQRWSNFGDIANYAIVFTISTKFSIT